MKLLLKVTLFIVVLLVVILGLLQIDDDLKPETKAWMERTQNVVNKDNDAYFYFLGLMAPEKANPIEVGKAIHQKALAQPIPQVTGEPQSEKDYFSVYQINNGLKVQPDRICRIFNATCFQELVNNKDSIDEIIQNNATLLQRYQTFLGMPDYQLMHPIGNWQSMPRYQHLIEANNISLIALLAVEDENTLNQKYSQLLKQTRAKLAQSGSLIEKMIYVALVNHNIEFYNLLHINNITEAPQSFTKLSPEEKSLKKVMGYETLSGSAMSNHFEFPWYSLINKAVIKQNMMLNYRYEFVRKYNELSVLPPHQQLKAYDTERYTSDEVSLINKYRNYSGWILSTVADSAYDDYVFRVSDLDAKIAVLNWRLQQPHDAAINEAYLEQHDTAKLNPYKTGSFFIKKEQSDKQKLLCVPLDIHSDHKNIRCVQL
ncbi:hypothetical protein [Kangiella marina]|uniref:Uncharacterized protein n=1 Tax=Kangiella marina TaxID=1079178 RepID=A0ABP8IE03_9GAMM